MKTAFKNVRRQSSSSVTAAGVRYTCAVPESGRSSACAGAALQVIAVVPCGGPLRITTALVDAFDAPGTHVFAVKLAYWFGM